MALLKVDWNPNPKKLRQFGIGIIGFSVLLFGISRLRGHHPPVALLYGGAALGLLTLASQAAAKAIYKAWMSVAFVIGTIVSTLVLGILYYAIITPVGLAMRMAGRDFLRVKKTPGDTYWSPIAPQEDNTYFERLF